jgi:hypothetical protein
MFHYRIFITSQLMFITFISYIKKITNFANKKTMKTEKESINVNIKMPRSTHKKRKLEALKLSMNFYDYLNVILEEYKSKEK